MSFPWARTPCGIVGLVFLPPPFGGTLVHVWSTKKFGVSLARLQTLEEFSPSDIHDDRSFRFSLASDDMFLPRQEACVISSITRIDACLICWHEHLFHHYSMWVTITICIELRETIMLCYTYTRTQIHCWYLSFQILAYLAQENPNCETATGTCSKCMRRLIIEEAQLPKSGSCRQQRWANSTCSCGYKLYLRA